MFPPPVIPEKLRRVVSEAEWLLCAPQTPQRPSRACLGTGNEDGATRSGVFRRRPPLQRGTARTTERSGSAARSDRSPENRVSVVSEAEWLLAAPNAATTGI